MLLFRNHSENTNSGVSCYPAVLSFTVHAHACGSDAPLSRPLDLVMERGQKIALVGANGIGKTTLLKSILGLIPALEGEVELKRALKEYRGSILLICHEPEFYEDIVSDVWDCAKWTTRII